MSQGSVAEKHASLEHEQAAAIPTAGVTALMLLEALVKAGGRVASCVGAANEADLARRELSGQNVMAVVTTERLEVLASHRAAGRLRDPEVETMPLDEASEALARVAGRHTRGKLVLKP